MLKFFKKFSDSTSKSTKKLFQNLGELFSAGKLNESDINNIEKMLYHADIGVKTVQEIIDALKIEYKKNKTLTSETVVELTKNIIKNVLQGAEVDVPKKNYTTQVICLIGVNGSGKTTTAAKLAHYFIQHASSVLFAACDTFRAAANDQIKIWSERLNIDIVHGQPGSDSAAVAYDAYQSARTKKRDFLIVDTAGRLHVKSNLMNELKKISKTLNKIDPNTIIYNWLVLDGNTGTNSLEIAKIFHQEIGVNGIIITKLDGSSRGGSIVSIYRELQIPVLFIGTGEQLVDLSTFSIEEYVNSLF